MTLKAKKTKFTFPDSGEEIYVVPYSVAAEALRLQRKFPRPMPPIVNVDMGNGHKVKEFNYADPDYDMKVAKWQTFVSEMAARKVFSKATNSIALNEKQKQVVELWKSENPDEWDDRDGDVDVWLEQIAITTDADFTAWTNFIRDGGQPSTEEVKAIQDGFPG